LQVFPPSADGRLPDFSKASTLVQMSDVKALMCGEVRRIPVTEKGIWVPQKRPVVSTE